LKTPDIFACPPGEIAHFSVKDQLEGHIDQCFHNPIELIVNVDRLPVYKSSSTQFWPVVAKIATCHKSDPFVCSLFYGNSKPSCVNAFIDNFISQVNSIILQKYNERIVVKVKSFVCDA